MQHPPLSVLAIAVLALALPVRAHEGGQVPAGVPDRLGTVSFPTSCSASAQKEFDRALAMLHSFYYPVAGQTFARAAEIDPSCAIAQWGVAMSQWYPLWYPPTRESFMRGKVAIESAAGLGAKTERERAYIDALAQFYTDFDAPAHAARVRAYEKAMAGLHERFPEDAEGSLFYALALQATADPNDKTYRNQLHSAELVERVFAAQPDHPGAAHYLIHAYDYPELAPRALPAARRYGAIAPSMPHALHMPSHTYIAVGLWQESIESNLAASDAARRLGWPQEELHSLDYLVYAYLQQGRGMAAQDVARTIAQVEPEDKVRTLPLDYARAAAQARLALEQRRWSDAASLPIIPSRFSATEALARFARALGAAHTGALTAAQDEELAALIRIRDALSDAKQDYWAGQVEIQCQTAQAWIEWMKGEADAAVAAMRAAAALEDGTYKHPVTPGQLLPARELLADMLLDLNQPAAALLEYEAALRANPNRFNGIYGTARSAELAGLGDKAAAYYRQLLTQGSSADTERLELQRARLYVAQR